MYRKDKNDTAPIICFPNLQKSNEPKLLNGLGLYTQ